jgi:LuxR family maltose regulon positive regulatory protein
MLLKTRFYVPPLRASGVIRERLLQRLKACSGGEFILISAPAGYGKTTLISQWLHFYPHRFAWLSLGKEHDTVDVFWRYVMVSLQQIQPQIGQQADVMWRSSAAVNHQQILISLLNDLDSLGEMNRSDDPLTLVLDDFHFLKNTLLLSLFNTFLDHLPSSIRVVLTSRDLPELNLSRRRANGQLVELGMADLRFNDAESVEFFNNTMAVVEPDQTAIAFCHKTEGWVAGLQMIALSLKQSSFQAGELLHSEHLDKYVADYLLDEVFAGQSNTIKFFLMVTALPQRFCAGLCNAVTGESDALRIISELESSDLFLVALDNHRTWYRYHDLFRQFLLMRAKQIDQEQLDNYCQRAIGWLEESGHYDDAIELSVQFGQWQDAIRLLSSELLQNSFKQNDSGEVNRYQLWLQKIPQQYLDQTPLFDVAASVPMGDASIPLASTPASSVEPLTRREQAVLELIGLGLPNKVIAEQLHISPNTLKIHIRNLYGKMGVENRTQALLKLNTSQ